MATEQVRRAIPSKKTNFLRLTKQKEALKGRIASASWRPAARRAFGDVVADQLAELENRQFLNIAQSLLPFATDTSLDLLGEIFGVPRLTQQTAGVDISEQNLEWYVRNGTFGAINGGRDIVIPTGVQIYTALSQPGVAGGSGVVGSVAAQSGPVYLAQAVTLPAAGSSQFFSAQSLYAGGAGNAPAGIFSLHNFTNYTESRYGSLLVMWSMDAGRRCSWNQHRILIV